MDEKILNDLIDLLQTHQLSTAILLLPTDTGEMIMVMVNTTPDELQHIAQSIVNTGKDSTVPDRGKMN